MAFSIPLEPLLHQKHLPGVSYGDRFVQLGSFRVGDVDGEHFTVTHVSGSTAAIYRKDGTVHAGPRREGPKGP